MRIRQDSTAKQRSIVTVFDVDLGRRLACGRLELSHAGAPPARGDGPVRAR